jgi:hypothetical protein
LKPTSARTSRQAKASLSSILTGISRSGWLRGFPPERARDLIYLDVPNQAKVFGFNPLERVSAGRRSLTASALVEVFKKIWSDSWGPRLEHILRNAIFCLLEQPEATLADIPRLLDDQAFSKRAAERVSNGQVRQFWLREYESYPARFRAEAIAPLQNKVGAFLAILFFAASSRAEEFFRSPARDRRQQDPSRQPREGSDG